MDDMLYIMIGYCSYLICDMEEFITDADSYGLGYLFYGVTKRENTSDYGLYLIRR